MSEPIKARATSAPWWNGVEILFRQGNSFGVSIQMEEKPAGVMVEPTVRISINEAQTLMDDLWNCGLRPTEGTGSAGAMKAVESHVNDLRKIAFKALDIPYA
ncbi:MAG: hypothetical protein EBR82_89020 [Caulobacteraceae bacterium]|nr:hypothetical protein [Caulobacteraceae bacterium]